MIKNIRHTGIVVVDMEASLNFYRDLFGFKVVKQQNETGGFIDKILGLSGVKVTTVKMVASRGQMIELLKYDAPPSKNVPRKICEIGISHIAFTVDDLNKQYARLQNEGVQFVSSPRLSPDGIAKVAFCRAPEGTFVELVEVI